MLIHKALSALLFICLFSKAASAQTIRIMDNNGDPVSHAEVMIGHAIDDPFENNFLVANADGEVQVPQEWTSPLPLTVEALGFIRTSFLARQPGQQDLIIGNDPGYDYLEVRGVTSGFGRIKTDKNIDLSLVSRMMKRDEFVYFTISDLISPYLDEVKVFTETFAVPSNLAIPDQKIKWSIFRFSLEKSLFRAPTKLNGEQRYFAARGEIDYSKIESGPGDIVKLLNEFKFSSGGFAKATPQFQDVDIDVGALSFDRQVSLPPPNFSSDEYVVAVALNEDKGHYFPSDAKAFTANKNLELKHPSTHTPSFIFLKGKQTASSQPGSVMSAILDFPSLKPKYDFLDLIPPPKISGNTLYIKPPVSQNIFPLGTYITLEDVKLVSSHGTQVQEVSRRWEIYADKWIGDVEIPEWPSPMTIKHQSRWTATYMGSTAPARSPMGPRLFEDATHISRNESVLQ